ncbi:MAG TPA: DUF501 domain-containing protein [Aquifex aeolicus]|uniref:DUF501 domain-containing protein n=1 Tax=Aquifex aeolicus TaxID=63363 RepID=A0A9D0YNF2_AQUAO|nr:DUF501 domain-containing protein [Aquificales bacterium]HIP97953.1 DUF501 domain-containing protein [Aquifex aeolicus]HIQ26182.1 DUF501 domain-containing protein [Aquifex aeolicus]
MPSISRKVVKLQIGRTPKGDFKVVRLCKFGFPQVIKNPPLVGNKPFPTTFWLTCPYLVKEISRLEEAGFIAFFEEKLKRNERLKRQYLKAHSFERMLRKPFIPKDLSFPIKRKLLSVGVGGIEKPLGVKCLHLHFASFLGGGYNPIGKEVLNYLPSLECRDNFCKKLLNERGGS